VQIRYWACTELGLLQADEAAIACLVQVLKKDQKPAVRAIAARSLARSRPPAAAALAEALSDPDVGVRSQAALSLRALGDPSLPPALVKETAKAAAPALVRRIADGQWHEDDRWSYLSGNRELSSKAAAVDALRLLDKDRVSEALIGALQSAKEEVRYWACTEVASLKDKESLAALTKVAQEDKSPQVKEAASKALGQRK
jgi:HEAT repeat protein